MRKLVRLACACTILLSAGLVTAQEIDVAIGGGTLLSPVTASSSAAFVPPVARGGIYPSVSAEVILENHFGFSAETSFRYNQGLYDGYQRFRPVYYDVNGVYLRDFDHRMVGDFMAGIGGQTLLFYNQFGTCTSGACPTSITGSNFLLHASGGLRYYFFRKVFVRPEVHYYRIIDNTQFKSGNILRVGASIGITFK